MIAVRRTTLLTPMCCLAFAVLPSSAQTTRDAAACSALTSLQIPGVNLCITKAEWFTAGSTPPRGGPGTPAESIKPPAFCRLDGVLDRRTGADSKPYGIGLALALPGDWNGRFLFQGGGGLNGSVQPLGLVARGGVPGLARGFGVVSTDTGHTRQGFDSSFMVEQQAALDFAYQAVGRVAVLAKPIMFFHGVSDRWFSALDSMDLLTPLVNWVEKGNPPSATATGRAFPGRSRPLCSYPQHPHYKGQGDPEKADSFECRK